MTSEEAFTAWVTLLGPSEGVLSMDPHDRGNWSSGMVGVGDLRGTKFGISAAAHPDIDIASLTLEQANQIRKEMYWDEVRGDEVPPALAIMLAEAGYMSGPEVAVRQLQKQLGFTGRNIDGIFGPMTMKRLQQSLDRASAFGFASATYDVVTEFAAQRMMWEASLSTWSTNKLGWTRRLMHDVALATLCAQATR